MKEMASIYCGNRFQPETINSAVWLYYQFYLRFRDVEALLAERGTAGSMEAIRLSCR